MSIEQKLKAEIKSHYKSMQNFADKANMPYPTVVNALRYGVEKCQFRTVARICEQLGISLDELYKGNIAAAPSNNYATDNFVKFLTIQKQQIEMELDRIHE